MPKTESFTRSETSSLGDEDRPSRMLLSKTNHPQLMQEQKQLKIVNQNYQASTIDSSRQKFGIIAEATKESFDLQTAVGTDED